MNGTTISNATTIDSGAGYYNFTVERTDTENYTYITDTKFFTVDPNPEELRILFNETSGIPYPATFRVWTNITTAFTLYRNGTTISNYSEQSLAAGTYNFSAQRTDIQNYSVIYNDTFFTLDKNPENCWVLFNETSPLSYPNTFRVWTNCTTPFALYRNGTEIGNNSEQTLGIGGYNFSFQREDNENYSIYYNESWFSIVDTTYPLIQFEFPTEPNDTEREVNWIYANVSVVEESEMNITFNLYYSNGTLVNSSFYTDKTREVNWTGLTSGNYSYNVTVMDYGGLTNSTETRIFRILMAPPVINLIYPTDNYNFSGYFVDYFNYSVNDSSEIINCSLYGDWAGGWHPNQTANSPGKEVVNNFSFIYTEGDEHYIWNVQCIDSYGNIGWNSTNYTFSTFLPVDPLDNSTFLVYMTKNDETGNVFMSWNSSNHTDKYKIYYTEDPLDPFTFLAETPNINYTDLEANQSRRRFYKLSASNPISEEINDAIIGKTVYYLKRKENGNTRNWLGIYLENNLTNANESLAEINNITSFTMWNSTIQKRVTCNTFSCPDFPSCTETNCNFSFGLMDGIGFEATLNSTSPIVTNWSTAGLVKSSVIVPLVKNLTSSGKNWVSLYYNSSLQDADGLMGIISYSDTVTNWDELNQKSEGWILSAFPFPIGTNFVLEPEKGYEVSVTQDCDYTQS